MTIAWSADRQKANIVRFFVIRHGQTDCNVQRILQGQKDVPLNQKGFTQAEQLGKVLDQCSFKFDWVVSSDLIRCKQTLNTILKVSKQEVPVTYYPELRERYLGVVQGMQVDKAEIYAQEHNKTSYRDFGETHKEFLDRFGTCFHAVAEKAANTDNIKKVAVITHGGAIRILLEWLHYRGDSSRIPNTSMTIIDYHKDTEKFEVKILADVGHL